MKVAPAFVQSKDSGKVYRVQRMFKCPFTSVKKVDVLIEDNVRGNYINTYPFALLEATTEKEYQKQKLQQALS